MQEYQIILSSINTFERYQQNMTQVVGNHYQEMLGKQVEPALVNVYLRLPDSRSVKIQLQSSLNLSFLKFKVAQLLKIPQYAQIIYYRGKPLKENKDIELAQKSILHIKDTRGMLQQITLHIICHEPQKGNLFKINNFFTTVLANQAETIRQFMERYLKGKQENIDLKRSRIIQCGRFLKLEDTFGECNIQNNAQIHVILKQSLLKNEVIEEEQNEYHDMLVKKVLKHSRHNSYDKDNNFEPFHLENTITAQKLFQSQYQLKSQKDKSENAEPTCQHICGQQQNRRLSLQPEIFNKTNPQFDKSALNKAMRSSWMNHTKSSQKWRRDKFKTSTLAPLKLGLAQYKKYDGPLSVRACNCKRKMFQSQQNIQSQGSCQHNSNHSPLLSKLSKSQSCLKKSFTLLP